VSGRARASWLIGRPTGDTWFVGSVGGHLEDDECRRDMDRSGALPPEPGRLRIAMSAFNNNVMYAGTGESMYNVDVINGDGMLKSTDRGVTWFRFLHGGQRQLQQHLRILIDRTTRTSCWPPQSPVATSRGT